MSNIDDMIDDMELEEFRKFDEELIAQGVRVAEAHGWGYSAFKSYVSKHYYNEVLKYDEDQWVFDFGCFVSTLVLEQAVHPGEWGELFYGNR